MDRLKRFLVMDDVRDKIGTPLVSTNAIEFDHVNAIWPAVVSAKSTAAQNKKTNANGAAAATLAPSGPSTTATPAVRDVDFTVAKGELIGVCGGVGSGKTSLLSVLLAQVWCLSCGLFNK